MTTTTSWSQLVANAYARPANIDWCEANYATLDWVAEAWNTFSSIPMSLIALYGFWRAKQHLKWETRWAMAWGLLGMVGVGSALFHATLRHIFQAADELPMLYCNLIFVYLMLEEGSGCTHAPRKRWLAPLLVRRNIFFSFSCKGGGRRVQVFICLCEDALCEDREPPEPSSPVAAGTVQTLCYFLFPAVYAVFLASYLSVIAWLVWRSVRLAWFSEDTSRLQQTLCRAALVFYVGGEGEGGGVAI